MLKYFESTIKDHPERQKYFKERGLSSDEAFACALALSFYTGYNGGGNFSSDQVNRGASKCIRTQNVPVEKNAIEKYFVIMHYMIKALAYIPYHWGACLRHVEISKEEQNRYQVGSIISWLQFSSSTSAEEGVSEFSDRNTVFHIYSLSGRLIQKFSNFNHEKEVLFVPWSTFMVTKKETSQGKVHIYFRQVELGTTKNTILWVDDNILDEKWENKIMMEFLTSQGLSKALRIIPKTSTKSALAFLDSEFGKYIKIVEADRTFQIISDMGRPKEKDGSEAGAILVKKLRERGFLHKFTIFTFSEEWSLKALTKHAGILLGNPQNYLVTACPYQFLEFVSPGSMAS